MLVVTKPEPFFYHLLYFSQALHKGFCQLFSALKRNFHIVLKVKTKVQDSIELQNVTLTGECNPTLSPILVKYEAQAAREQEPNL